MVEVVKSEPSQNVAYPAEVYEGGEEEGQLAQYDETYAGEYEEPQYSEQYGMMDQDNSQQGELQHPTSFWSTQALSLARSTQWMFVLPMFQEKAKFHALSVMSGSIREVWPGTLRENTPLLCLFLVMFVLRTSPVWLT